MSDEVTEAELDSAMARTFGRPDPANVVLFRQAGFDEEAAQKGAKLMESGAFFGFEDVATTMMLQRDGSVLKHRNVSAASIAEVARTAPGLEVAESSQAEKVPEGGAGEGAGEVTEADIARRFPLFGSNQS